MSTRVPGVKVYLDLASRQALEQLASRLSLSESSVVRLALRRLQDAEGLHPMPELGSYLRAQRRPPRTP